MRRASEPMHITPILSSQPEDASATPRRVYFEDSSISPITRRNTLPEPKQSARLLDAHAAVDATVVPLFTSPLATTSALPPQDISDDHPADSDSSPHSSKASSLKSTSRLQKLKLFGNKTGLSHRPEPLDKPSDQGSIASTGQHNFVNHFLRLLTWLLTETSTSEKSARRASGGFVAGWTLSRNRGTVSDVTTSESSTASPSRLSFARRMSPSRPVPSPSTATPTSAGMPSELLSPTFLTRKSQKRVSAPIPRTSPYGAPYFAAPPLLLDSNYQAYLKTLPQFEDEIKTTTSQTFDGEPERGRGRTSSIRRVNLGSLPPKPRSASVDMTTRRDVIA